MNNNDYSSDYNENYLLLNNATVAYDEAGVLWIDGVPVMPQAFSVETEYAYELYLEFNVGGYEDECDGLYGYREVADDDTNFNAAKYSGSVNLVAPYIEFNSPF